MSYIFFSLDDDNVSHCSSSFSKASTPDEKKDDAEDEDWTVVNKTPEATPIKVVEVTPEVVASTSRDIPIQVHDPFVYIYIDFQNIWPWRSFSDISEKCNFFDTLHMNHYVLSLCCRKFKLSASGQLWRSL